MNKKIPRYAKVFIVALLLVGLFIGGIFLEEALRTLKTAAILVDSSEVPEVTIAASQKPDFLWLGTAWWIDYESPIPFDLDIGSGNAVRVPAGKHKIFSNHDSSNLDRYGLGFSEKAPEAILAQQAQP